MIHTLPQFEKTCTPCQRCQVLMMDVGEAPLPSVHLKFRLSPVPSPKCIYLRPKLLPFKALLAGYRGSGTLCSQCPGTQIGMHKI